VSQNGQALGSTSVTAPGPFTVRGLMGSGPYVVNAWLDVPGVGSYVPPLDPSGSVQLSSLSGNPTVTLTPPAAFPLPAAPKFDGVMTGDGCAVAFFTPVTDGSGQPLADHYRLYVSEDTTPGPTDYIAVRTVGAWAQNQIFLSGLENGRFYAAALSAVAQGQEGPLSPVEFFGTQAPGPGATLAGSVDLGGGLPEGVLYLMATTSTFGTIQAIVRPTASQPFAIGGLPPGSYSLTAIFDSLGDGEIGPLDPVTSPGHGLATLAVGSSGATDAGTLDLSGNAQAEIDTGHFEVNGSEGYNLNLLVDSRRKLPVQVTLASGPLANVPTDLAINPNGTGGPASPAFQWSGNLFSSTAPGLGDSYQVDVTYADGSAEALTAAVTGILALPTNLSPQGTGSRSPTFTWTAPSPAPAVYNQSLGVFQHNGPYVWSDFGLPPSVTSVTFDANGSATQPTLTPGSVYDWNLVVEDPLGNYGGSQVTFTAQ
jgi:hypothetical protein